MPFFFPSWFVIGGSVGIGLEKEFGVATVDATDENAERFAVRAKNEKQRCSVDAIENGRLFRESFPRIGARGAINCEPDDDVASV